MNQSLEPFQAAFLLGFLVTREGFNDEYVCDHLAPDRLEPDDRHTSIQQRLEELSQRPELSRLMAEAIAWLRREGPEADSPILDHARREFAAAGYTPLDQEQEDDPNKWIQENVLELLQVFSSQGHSGSSAPWAIGCFEKLARFEPLCPLTGEDSEWNDLGEGRFQNKRCSHVFKDLNDNGGQAYDIQGRIFCDPNGCCYTSRDSRVYITFPYTPKREYVDVPARVLVEEDNDA